MSNQGGAESSHLDIETQLKTNVPQRWEKEEFERFKADALEVLRHLKGKRNNHAWAKPYRLTKALVKSICPELLCDDKNKNQHVVNAMQNILQEMSTDLRGPSKKDLFGSYSESDDEQAPKRRKNDPPNNQSSMLVDPHEEVVQQQEMGQAPCEVALQQLGKPVPVVPNQPAGESNVTIHSPANPVGEPFPKRHQTDGNVVDGAISVQCPIYDVNNSTGAQNPVSRPEGQCYKVPQCVTEPELIRDGWHLNEADSKQPTQSYVEECLKSVQQTNVAGIPIEYVMPQHIHNEFCQLPTLPERLAKRFESPELREYIERQHPSKSKEDIDLLIEIIRAGHCVHHSGPVNADVLNDTENENDILRRALTGQDGFPMMALMAVRKACGVDLSKCRFSEVVRNCRMITCKEAVIYSNSSPTGGLHDDSDASRVHKRKNIWKEFRLVRGFPEDPAGCMLSDADPDSQGMALKPIDTNDKWTQQFVVVGKHLATPISFNGEDRNCVVSEEISKLEGMVDSEDPSTRALARNGTKQGTHFTKTDKLCSANTISSMNEKVVHYKANPKCLFVWGATHPAGRDVSGRGLHGAAPPVKWNSKKSFFERKVFTQEQRRNIPCREGSVSGTIAVPVFEGKMERAISDMACSAVYTFFYNAPGCHTPDTDIEKAKTMGEAITVAQRGLFAKDQGGYGAYFAGDNPRFSTSDKAFIKYLRAADATLPENKGFRHDIPPRIFEFFSKCSEHGKRRVLAVKAYLHHGEVGLNGVCDGNMQLGSPAINHSLYGLTEPEGKMFCRSLALAIVPFTEDLIQRLRREENEYLGIQEFE